MSADLGLGGFCSAGAALLGPALLGPALLGPALAGVALLGAAWVGAAWVGAALVGAALVGTAFAGVALAAPVGAALAGVDAGDAPACVAPGVEPDPAGAPAFLPTWPVGAFWAEPPGSAFAGTAPGRRAEPESPDRGGLIFAIGGTAGGGATVDR